MQMFSTGTPQTRNEILAMLQQLHGESNKFLGSLTDVEFFTPQAGKWSPAEQVRHLIKSVRPISQVFRLPRVVLALLFGRPRERSRSFTNIEVFYQSKLQTGVTAGRFAPSPQPTPSDLRTARAAIMLRWQDVHRQLQMAIAKWSEDDLDGYRLPHPVLGKLTIREMLFFTLYHNAHHVRQVYNRSKLS